MNNKNRFLAKLLAKVLYEVLRHRVSVDVAFKRVCRSRCASSLKEREEAYEKARAFVSDYIKLRCIYRRLRSLTRLAAYWLKGIGVANLPEWCELSYPEWFYRRMKPLVNDEVYQLLESMNQRIWWLRINTLKVSEDKVIRELESEGVEFSVDREIPYMIRILRSSKPIRLLKPVKNYEAIPQDKASSAVVEALQPEPSDLILDMSFAPGMKTSLMEMLAENKAKIVALDISYKRILSGRLLLKKLGVDMSRVHIVLADAAEFASRDKFDKVLLDAPCSNSGAISKDPGLKVHLNEGKISYYSNIQKMLLYEAIKLGEEITYSTCSLFPEEGEEVVEVVSERVRFEKTIPWASPGYKVSIHYSDLMRLYPHRHHTEGFFIAKLLPR